jgi:hypothetical protein
LTWVGYVQPGLDMTDLDSSKAKIAVTFGSDRSFRSNEVDEFYDTLEDILSKE